MKLSQIVRTKRKEKKWTQQKLAEKAGISSVYVSRIENNKAKQVSFDVVKRVLKALDIPLDNYIQEHPDVLSLKESKAPYGKDKDIMKKIMSMADEILADMAHGMKYEAILDIYEEIIEDRDKEKDIPNLLKRIKKYAYRNNKHRV